MKKSEIYRTAMRTVVSSGLSADTKIEVMAELLDKEKSALYWEQKEEEEAQAKETEKNAEN